MKSTEKKFPIYRKYVGVETYFKIINDREFIELKKVGTKYTKFQVEAKQFPEIQFIKDMINLYENRWAAIDEEIYARIQTLITS